jgi:hypothetical protein
MRINQSEKLEKNMSISLDRSKFNDSVNQIIKKQQSSNKTFKSIYDCEDNHEYFRKIKKLNKRPLINSLDVALVIPVPSLTKEDCFKYVNIHSKLTSKTSAPIPNSTNKNLTKVLNKTEQESQIASDTNSNKVALNQTKSNEPRLNNEKCEEKCSEREQVENDDREDAQSTASSFDFKFFSDSELDEEKENEANERTPKSTNSQTISGKLGDSIVNQIKSANSEPINKLIQLQRKKTENLTKELQKSRQISNLLKQNLKNYTANQTSISSNENLSNRLKKSISSHEPEKKASKESLNEQEKLEKLKSNLKPTKKTIKMNESDLSAIRDTRNKGITKMSSGSHKSQCKQVKSFSSSNKPIRSPSLGVSASSSLGFSTTRLKETPKTSSSFTSFSCSNEKNNRETYQEHLFKDFKKRLSEAPQILMTDSELRNLVSEIENQLHEKFKNSLDKYINKLRTIRKNISFVENDTFYKKILTGVILPKQLPEMNNEDMASDRVIAERQENKRKESDLILQSQKEIQEQKRKILINRTKQLENFDTIYFGQANNELLSDSIENDVNKERSKSPTQTQTSPTALSESVEGNQKTDSQNIDDSSQNRAANTIDPVVSFDDLFPEKKASSAKSASEEKNASDEMEEKDTTKEHGIKHTFHLLCKICLKNMSSSISNVPVVAPILNETKLRPSISMPVASEKSNSHELTFKRNAQSSIEISHKSALEKAATGISLVVSNETQKAAGYEKVTSQLSTSSKSSASSSSFKNAFIEISPTEKVYLKQFIETQNDFYNHLNSLNFFSQIQTYHVKLFKEDLFLYLRSKSQKEKENLVYLKFEPNESLDKSIMTVNTSDSKAFKLFSDSLQSMAKSRQGFYKAILSEEHKKYIKNFFFFNLRPKPVQSDASQIDLEIMKNYSLRIVRDKPYIIGVIEPRENFENRSLSNKVDQKKIFLDKHVELNACTTNAPSDVCTPSTCILLSTEDEKNSNETASSKTKRKCDSGGDLEEQTKRRKTDAEIKNTQGVEAIETKTNENNTREPYLPADESRKNEQQQQKQNQELTEQQIDAMLRKNIERQMKDPRIKRKLEDLAKSSLIFEQESQARPAQQAENVAIPSNENKTNDDEQLPLCQISTTFHNTLEEESKSDSNAAKHDETVASTSTMPNTLSEKVHSTNASIIENENIQISYVNKSINEYQAPSWHGDSKTAFENLLKMHATQLAQLSFHNPKW